MNDFHFSLDLGFDCDNFFKIFTLLVTLVTENHAV